MTGPLRHRGPAMAEKKTKKMTCITLILLYDSFMNKTVAHILL